MAPTEQDIFNLRTSLKRCSADTVEAAVRFRVSGDLKEVPTIVYGIIERHLSPEHNRSLAAAADETRLIEDLGIDSLTLLEIVLSIEETLNISIENEELREILTLGQVKTFIAKKISGTDEPDGGKVARTRKYTREEIALRLPQQPPFFFLDDALIDGNAVRAQYQLRGDEFFLEGHFKDNPVMPASIVFEAIGQAACLWVLECAPEQLHVELQSNEVLFASMEEAHFYRRAKPGDVLELEAELVRLRAPLAIFRGSAKLRGEKLAQIEHLVLAFGQEVVEHLGKRENEAAAAHAGTEQNGARQAAHEVVPSRNDLKQESELTGSDAGGRQ
jgi:acyl carrier protein